MAGIREIEGIGYFDYTHGGDYLLVEQWIKRPDDLHGQALTVLKILPPDYRRAGTDNTGGDGQTYSRRFRFRISVEVERASGRLPVFKPAARSKIVTGEKLPPDIVPVSVRRFKL